MTATLTGKVVWLCSSCGRGEGEYIIGTIASDGICARCGSLAMEVYDARSQEPRRASYRPDGFVTSLALDLPTRIIWDVAGYYRSLSVDPRATRREIREAYQRAQGWDSDHLTYVVKKLLNPEVRERYDACPPWCVWFDRYVLEAVQARILGDLSQKARMDSTTMDNLEAINLDQYVDQPFEVVLDGRRVEDHDDPTSEWPWGFYLWQTHSKDTARLARWQEHLIAVLAERKERRTIAVGLMGMHMACPFEVAEVGSRLVVFLRTSEWPSADLAVQAADRVVSTIP